MKQIKTVAGVIRNEKGEVLCTLRDQGKYDYVSFKWEFPGGKIEEGETKEEALALALELIPEGSSISWGGATSAHEIGLTEAVINGNYAIAANLKISDALATESATGEAAQLYANIIAVKTGNEDNAKIKALIEALQTEEIYNFIQSTFDGAVQPAFTL